MSNGNANGNVVAQVSAPLDREYYERRQRTGPQLDGGQVGILSDAELQKQDPCNNRAAYRKMLGDPTISFARMLCVAPLVMAGWSYEENEDAPDGAREFIEKQLDAHRVALVKSIMEAYIDEGWSGHEMVYSPVSEYDTRIGIVKAKELLPEMTHILVNRYNGDFVGFRQYNYARAGAAEVDLSIYDSLYVGIDVKGTQWYGRALLENARGVYGMWNDSNLGATKYDTKIAGAHWVIHYPIGTSPYGVEKVDTDNYEIAMKLLGALTASGKLAVPIKLGEFVDEMNATHVEDIWKIELISDSGAGAIGFIDRQKYLDALKVRAFGFPERAVLEGQFGTKAEAETHADAAISIQEMRHALILVQINKMIVNYLLEVNYGYQACGSVTAKARPLVDSVRVMLKQLYMAVIANPSILMQEVNLLDMAAIRKMLGVPERADIEQAQADATAASGQQQAQGMLSDYFGQLDAEGRAA